MIPFAFLLSYAGEAAVGPAPQPGSTSTTAIVAVLAALGLGAIISALVAGLFSRRKLGAEATQLIQSAASGVVKDMESQLLRQQSEHERQMMQQHEDHRRGMERIMADHEREMSVVRDVLQQHVTWDYEATRELEKVGIKLPPPPPLLPPPGERIFI